MRVKMIYEKDDLVFVDPADSQLLEIQSKKDTREGEDRLMLAVLEDAIEYFQEYVLAENKKGKELFQEAEEWILEKDSDWIFSFENICEVLRLNPNYLRQGLLRWKEAKRNGCPKDKNYSPAARKKTKKHLGVHQKNNGVPREGLLR